MATYSANTTLKVNRAITGATTVNANSYAIVSYEVTSVTSSTGSTDGASFSAQGLINRYFGPGQSIPATINRTFGSSADVSAPNTGSGSATWTLVSGVEFSNTP